MKKSLLFGIILLGTLFLLSFVLQDYSLIINIGVTIGVVCIIISGFITGVFQQRSVPAENYPLEGKELRDTKTRWSTNLFLFGLPSLIGAIITYILFN